MIGMHRFLPSKAGNKGITMKSLKFSPLLKGRKTNIGMSSAPSQIKNMAKVL
jgi:hypothetical protein